MSEGLPGWAEEVGDEERPRRATRPWVLVLATVPWLVVLGLVLGGVVSGDRAAPAAPVAPDEPSTHPPAPTHDAPDMEPEDRPTSPPEHDTSEHDGSVATPIPAAAQVDPVGPVALAVARAWLTDVGPRLELEGIAPRDDLYLEHGVVEHIEVHGDHAVVGVLAVVLVREDERYTRVLARRIAVPVALGPPVRPAGAPWWLGEVDLTTVPPDPLVEEDDPEVLLELGEALATAGVLDGEVLGASRTGDGWWLTRIGDPDTPQEQLAVWLRPTPAGPVVAGLSDEHGTDERGADEHVHEE
jgi:hypothetical protein